MTTRLLLPFLCLTAAGLLADEPKAPTLALGAKAPDFDLPGVDGRNHTLAEFAGKPVLVVLFTCNHCPTAQYYEERIKQIAADYGSEGRRPRRDLAQRPRVGAPRRDGLDRPRGQPGGDEGPRP